MPANTPTTTTTPATPAPTTSRTRRAFDEAKKRVPVKITLNEAHALIVKLALGTVKTKAHKPVIKEWLEERLRSDYGKALLGALIASPIGVPLWASMLGKSGAAAEAIADEFATAAMETAGVKLGGDVLKLLPRGFIAMASKLFESFEALAVEEQPTALPSPRRNELDDLVLRTPAESKTSL